MTGAFLIGFLIFGIIFLIISFIDDYNDDFWGALGIAFIVVALIFVIAIPISRLDSKTNAAYAKVFQETLDYNRANIGELNVLERTTILEEINSCNSKINTWKVEGEKWYNNKWYYHPDTQEVEFIK